MRSKNFLKKHANSLLVLLRIFDSLLPFGVGIFIYAVLIGSWHLPDLYIAALLFASFLSLPVFSMFKLYKAWRGGSINQEALAILKSWFILFTLLVLTAFLSKLSEDFSRQWLICWLIAGSSIHIISRLALRALLRYTRSLGFNKRHILIFGCSETGRQVVGRLTSNIETGFHIIGYFSADATSKVPVSGNIEDGINLLSKSNADQVWIAMPLSEEKLIQYILEELKDSTADIRLVPDIFGFRLINHSISSVADLPILNLSAPPMEGINYWIKTLEDKIFASVILILLSPLLLILAIGVKLSSPGPVFYRQERLSWNGKAFSMLKFRSMPIDAEAESGAVWAKKGEARATPFGSFLRKTSLDELPQFWNVLAGDMSIVGPRPERPIFVEQFKDDIPGYMLKHVVKGGITGWAQVNGWRGNTDINKRIEHDLYYIENWSFWMDIKIIFLTVFKGFAHKNAY